MQKCRLCKINEATKKNTHYLTDGVIKQALNQEGSNTRDKGFLFDMSSKNKFIEFRFQRNTSMNYFEKESGRLPSEKEIEKAKENLFSVDYIFCPNCEDIFTDIETPFLSKILPKLRNKDISKKTFINFKEVKLIRLFIYIQVWRTAICDKTFDLPNDVLEKLRKIIINNKNQDFRLFPVTMTFLITEGKPKNYTENSVGYTSDKNPYFIWMNDLIIQFFESREKICFDNFCSINDLSSYMDFINLNEEEFIVPILSNERRKEIMLEIMKDAKGLPLLDQLADIYSKLHTIQFKRKPTIDEINRYIKYIISKEEPMIDKYTSQSLHKHTLKYFGIEP